MKFFVSSKVCVLLIGFCAALFVGAGSAEANFIFGTPSNLGPVVNSSAGGMIGGVLELDGLHRSNCAKNGDIWWSIK